MFIAVVHIIFLIMTGFVATFLLVSFLYILNFILFLAAQERKRYSEEFTEPEL